MSDRSDDPESGAGEATPPKIKAEDNPWYLPATLYGEPEVADFELQEKNRVAWNRNFAAELTEKTRTKLIEEKRHPAEELAPSTFQSLSLFVNAEMKGMTSFENATFKTEPPRFSGAKLHEGTIWRGINKWPTPKKVDEAGAFVDAYERLKLEMNRLQKHEDELDFFALELQSRRLLLGTLKSLPITIYGFLSDYGRSYFWPFYWLVVTVAAGAWIFSGFDALGPLRSYGLSAANTLNLFGFRKDFFDSDFMKNLPPWLEVVSAIQTILGTILLFLFGLGVRNKFRMK